MSTSNGRLRFPYPRFPSIDLARKSLCRGAIGLPLWSVAQEWAQVDSISCCVPSDISGNKDRPSCCGIPCPAPHRPFAEVGDPGISRSSASAHAHVDSLDVDNRANVVPALSDRRFLDAVACDYLLVSLRRSLAISAHSSQEGVVRMARYRRTGYHYDALERSIHLSGALMDGSAP